jgi:hypothetical protein
MKFFALRNLCSSDTSECVPWDFGVENLARVPQVCFTDKKKRTTWANTPATNFQMYSAIEGVNPNIRISEGKDNPPHSMGGLPVDVDCTLSRAELDGAFARMGTHRPNYVETTFSGHFRLVWIFEKPLGLIDSDYATFLLERIHEIIPYRQLPGVDEGAVTSCTRYYTNGARWEKIHDTPFPADLLLGWEVKTSAKFAWNGSERGPSIPLDKVAPELAKKYPRFAEWQGDFTLGSSGPSFWVDGSTSDKSAIVRETGIQTFAAHAAVKFAPWSDLLGAQFVSEYKTAELGKAVDGIYYDGQHYIRKQLSGEWLFGGMDELSRYLRTECGLSDRRPKGLNCSPVDEAVQFIQNHAFITSAGSFAFYPKGIMVYPAGSGRRFLNLHNRDVLSPSGGNQVWGPDGKFPFLSKFYDGWMVNSAEAMEAYLSWLAYAYKGCYIRDPQPGQVAYFIGPPGCGKTLNTRSIVGALFGGFAECQDWIMGRDNFNSELFDMNVWAIDDNTLGLDYKHHRQMTEMLKRASANQSFRCNEKFRKAGLIQWAGRICASCNDDADSLGAIPELGMGNMDKLCLFRCAPARTDGFEFPERSELSKIITTELPFLAQFLLDYAIPDRRLGKEKRFGPLSYHDASIIMEANQSSPTSACGQMVDEWMRQIFTEKHPDRDQWTGTPFQLLQSMMGECNMGASLGQLNVTVLDKMLPKLANKGFDIKSTGDSYRRLFTISRGSRYPRKAKAEKTPETPNNPYAK